MNEINKYYIGYCRVSTKYQATEGVSLDMQKNEIYEYIQKENVEVKIMIEAGKSAKKGSFRPIYAEALNQTLTNDNCIGIISYSLSRIGRSMRQLIDDVDNLDKKGKEIIFLKEKIDRKTIAGRMLFHMLCAVAEFENDMRREALADGYAEYRRNKGIVGRKNIKLLNFDEIVRDYKLGGSLEFLRKKVEWKDGSKRLRVGISKPTLIKKLREFEVYDIK